MKTMPAQGRMVRWLVIAGLVALAPVGQLQAQSTAPVVTPNTPPAAGMPPLVDLANELTGLALVKALREGGFVLFMRHAFSAGPLPACPQESGLAAPGIAQAQAVGAALRALKIPISSVQASATCRAKDTATLMDIGPVQVNLALNPVQRDTPQDYETRFGYLRQQVPAGANVMLVSHVQGGRTREESILIDYAEVVVYRWSGSVVATPVARIPQRNWQLLIDMAAGAR